MDYILMHKDVKVLKFKLDDRDAFDNVIEIYDINHIPFSTDRDLSFNHKAIREWWADRSIPLSRNDYSLIKEVLPNDDSLSLVVKSHALSLDDQYWIKKEDEDINYDDISFFSNDFKNDIGDILVGIKDSGPIDYYSPDSTSNGNLKKRWKNINGVKYLLKAGTKPNQYEIFNEIIASKVMTLLNIDHVDYELIIDNGHIYSASKNFVSYNEDLVSAYQLRYSKKQTNHTSLYCHLLSIYNQLDIPEYKKKIDQMLFIDYLLGNEDRHLNNFGVIRDAKTLKFLRVAPIYDTGSCLGYNLKDEALTHSYHVEWKPFMSQQVRSQLELINDFSWLNIKVLKTIPHEVDDLLTKYGTYVSPNRRKAINRFLVGRINNILSYIDSTERVDEVLELHSLPLLEEEILEYVEKKGKLVDLDPLIKRTGKAYITIYRAVSSLTFEGYLIRVGSRKTGYWTLP